MEVAEKFGMRVQYERLAPGVYGATDHTNKTIVLATEDCGRLLPRARPRNPSNLRAQERPRAGAGGRDHSAARGSHPRQALRQARGQLQLELHRQLRPVQQPPEGRKALHARPQRVTKGSSLQRYLLL